MLLDLVRVVPQLNTLNLKIDTGGIEQSQRMTNAMMQASHQVLTAVNRGPNNGTTTEFVQIPLISTLLFLYACFPLLFP